MSDSSLDQASSPLQDKSNSPLKGQDTIIEPPHTSPQKNQHSYDIQPEQLPPLIPIQPEEKEIKDLNTTITKLRAQNDYLRRQVKDLNNRLTSALEMASKKIKPKSDQVLVTSEAVLKKQLQTAYKQIDTLKKQVQGYVDKIDNEDIFEKAKKLEDLVAEKDMKIEVLNTEKKVLEKINRDQNKELDTYQNSMDFEKKMNSQVEEIKGLRDKVANMQAVNRHNEKNFMKQQEHLVAMTQQYRLTCEKLGISANTPFTKADELEQLIKKSGKGSRTLNEIPAEGEEATVPVTVTKNSGHSLPKVGGAKTERNSSFSTPLRTRTINQATAKNIREQSAKPRDASSAPSEDSYKKDMSTLQTRIYLLESERRQLKQKLLESEKKAAVVKKNPADIAKSVMRHRSLPRLNLVKGAESHQVSMNISNIPVDDTICLANKTEAEVHANDSQIIINSKTARNVSPQPYTNADLPPKKPLITMRRAMGGRIEHGLYEFTDKEFIANPITSRINKMVVFSDDEFVYGVQAFYTVQNLFYVAGEEHISSDMKEKAKYETTVGIDNEDPILWISGRYDDGITFLKVRTVKGVVWEFGNEKSGSNEFKINLESTESLAMLQGALCYKKGERGQDDLTILANIGFTLVKEAK